MSRNLRGSSPLIRGVPKLSSAAYLVAQDTDKEALSEILTGRLRLPEHQERGPCSCPLRKRFRVHLESGSVHRMSDKFAMHGMHNGLKTAMCPELVVNVVEMVAERLQADTQRPCDFT